ncbi:histone-lysine N-methyltransferase set1 [Bombus vosnesenskii]|uniref:Histone-lysine N-methyltransferase set1 n=1 Tax=Bombus vosnesenskii TaxID=207650 RepID=A0A6J3L683_9HYME|nr:histone-lysine N-methyltransferase set1 [Bombus vosnesenskii]
MEKIERGLEVMAELVEEMRRDRKEERRWEKEREEERERWKKERDEERKRWEKEIDEMRERWKKERETERERWDRIMNKDKEVWEYLRTFDVIGLTETWIEESKWERVKHSVTSCDILSRPGHTPRTGWQPDVLTPSLRTFNSLKSRS